MFGLDQAIAALGGGGPLVILAVALLLGLRHAADPDHLVAVSTVVASERVRPARRATILGLSWGLGHATTLLVFGLPIVLFGSYLPDPAQRAAEALVGVVIVVLALRLLLRWRQGRFHSHRHSHDGVVHRHLHAHEHPAHEHEHRPLRSPRQAYGIGCLHGAGGSAGVGVLLLASIPGTGEAIAALAVFAGATALSMGLLSSLLGCTLAVPAVERRLQRLVPVLAGASLLFGAWYGAAALL